MNGFPDWFNFSFQPLWDNALADQVFQGRKSFSEFSRRPFVLGFQHWTKTRFNWPYQFSFNLINGVALVAFFSLLPKLEYAFNPKLGQANKYILVYTLLHLPIIYVFFSLIYTYDDLVQYVLVIIALIYFQNNKLLLAVLAFSLACIARETSFLYLPLLLFLQYQKNGLGLSFLMLLILPLLSYVLFIHFYVDVEINNDSAIYLKEERFGHLKRNFLNWERTRETITVVITMLGMPTYLFWRSLRRHKERQLSKLAYALILTNAVVVLIGALAREARLLYLPLIFANAVYAVEIKDAFQEFYIRVRYGGILRKSMIISSSILISVFWYPQDIYVMKLYFFFYFYVLFELMLSRTNFKLALPKVL
ncbi:MAG: hypothetical protein AAFO07_03685 [Bacteroidota bacterium]